MDNPDFIACSFIENSIGLKKVNRLTISETVVYMTMSSFGSKVWFYMLLAFVRQNSCHGCYMKKYWLIDTIQSYL